jgi:hypothetical protein
MQMQSVSANLSFDDRFFGPYQLFGYQLPLDLHKVSSLRQKIYCFVKKPITSFWNKTSMSSRTAALRFRHLLGTLTEQFSF